MLKKMNQAMKNEKGLTLIELLAVVVILGIISAIAIPSIGGIIKNSEKDAHIANGQQMVSAAKLAQTDDNTQTSWTLEKLVSDGFLDKVKNPSGGGYDEADGYDPTASKVTLSNGEYLVTLIGKDKKTYYSAKNPSEIKRGDVTIP